MPEFNPQLDPATGWWVTGLTDGEGCKFVPQLVVGG
jgi:hypothetical protein